MSQFRNFDTKRADGVYVTFAIAEEPDYSADPKDYLFQDDAYREQDQARLDAWERDEWHFIGIQAKARVEIVRNGHGVIHTLTSAGLWGIESDSGQDYFNEVFEEQKSELLDDLKAFGTLPITIQ